MASDPHRALMRCPQCGKRGVSMRFGTGDDYYGCRYCDWSAYTGGSMRPDVIGRRDLRVLNPEHPYAPREEGPPFCYDCSTNHWPEEDHNT